MTELQAGQLYRSCKLDNQDFTTTADLQALDKPPGQRRALEALKFGVAIKRRGFNVFAFGPPGIGKSQLVSEVLKLHGARDSLRYDWCYVNNFADPGKPRLLQLPTGLGARLAADMLQLVEDMLIALPSSFQSAEYQARREEIESEMSERQEEAFSELGASAKDKGIALIRTPAGYTLAPMIEDKVITPEQLSELSEQEQQKLQEVIGELQSELQKVVSKLPVLKREASHRIKALNEEVTQLTVEQFVATLEQRYADEEQVMQYLSAVKVFAIENAEDFLNDAQGAEEEQPRQKARKYTALHVNVLVDNTGASGEPVVFEDNPTYQNLNGRVEHISQMGTLLTDFTLIKPGALHRANGGYLIVEARKLLSNVYAWEGLKQALHSGKIKIASLQDVLSLTSTLSLDPESAPLDVKVVLLGEPFIYYLMDRYDPDFRQLFHVAADFSDEMDWNPDGEAVFARQIATQQQGGLRPLERDAVALVIEQTARWAGDSEKLSLNRDRLGLLLQESDYCAQHNGNENITRADVEQAIAQERERGGKLRELLNEQILREFRLVATEGEKTGQVNGLSVLQQGDLLVGIPSRITATARLGTGKVIDIERESKLGGDIHSKGVMILCAYLAHRYARNNPLPVAATLVFEQSYGGVDGDSASCAELCALLSALAGLPLNQNFAVTGSMNQSGDVQAIGGVNEKIEGFFDICKARGLTGDQGVIIPQANRVHLMLNREVQEAVASGQFHIFTATHVEQVMELLSGLPAGTQGKDGSFAGGSFQRAVQQRIEELQELHNTFADPKRESGEH
ncbi:MAG: AAA family ATPase [Halioglobus sp.]|nr:AAA family ATPase [Halioglobus sp.]